MLFAHCCLLLHLQAVVWKQDLTNRVRADHCRRCVCHRKRRERGAEGALAHLCRNQLSSRRRAAGGELSASLHAIPTVVQVSLPGEVVMVVV